MSAQPLPVSDVTLSLSAPGLTFQPSMFTFVAGGSNSFPFHIIADPDIATNPALPVKYAISGTNANLYAAPVSTISIIGNLASSSWHSLFSAQC